MELRLAQQIKLLDMCSWILRCKEDSPEYLRCHLQVQIDQIVSPTKSCLLAICLYQLHLPEVGSDKRLPGVKHTKSCFSSRE